MAEDTKLDLNVKNKAIAPTPAEIKITAAPKPASRSELMVDILLLKYHELRKSFGLRFQGLLQHYRTVNQKISSKVQILRKKETQEQLKATVKNKTIGLIGFFKEKLQKMRIDSKEHLQKIKENIQEKLSKMP